MSIPPLICIISNGQITPPSTSSSNRGMPSPNSAQVAKDEGASYCLPREAQASNVPTSLPRSPEVAKSHTPVAVTPREDQKVFARQEASLPDKLRLPGLFFAPGKEKFNQWLFYHPRLREPSIVRVPEDIARITRPNLPMEAQRELIRQLTLSWLPCVRWTIDGQACVRWSMDQGRVKRVGICPCIHPVLLPEGLHLLPEEMHRLAPGLSRDIPDRLAASISTTFQQEIYQIFFTHNIFVFNRRGGDKVLHDRAMMGPLRDDFTAWQDIRDPVATRLLEFTDTPTWKDKGSKYLQNQESFKMVKKYRSMIRNIIFDLKNPWSACWEPDWNWPLKVKWDTLPNLEFLQLDLRTFSRHFLMTEATFTTDEYMEILVFGSKTMACLNLRKLILVGLCSHYYWGHEAHRRTMETLFRPAMREGGEIKFLDQEMDWCLPKFVRPIKNEARRERKQFKANPAWVDCRNEIAERNRAVIEEFQNGPRIIRSGTGEEDIIIVGMES